MKKIIVCLIILLSAVTVQATDYTHELCQCLIYHAYEHYNLGDITDREELITRVMNTCYPIHAAQVMNYAPNGEIAADMMGEEEVENAYEELAEAAVDIVIKGSKQHVQQKGGL